MSAILARTVTNDEIRCFQRDGVVLLRGLLTLRAVNSLRAAIDAVVRTSSSSRAFYNLTTIASAVERKNMTSLDDVSDGQHNVRQLGEMIAADGRPLLRDQVRRDTDGKGAFLLDSGVSSRLKDFRRLAHAEDWGDVTGALMDASTVRFFDDQVFIKEPGCLERTAFHQDAPYFHVEGSQMCVCWVPVDPVTEENGAMRYVRGSHRWNKLYQPNTFISPVAFPGAPQEPVPDIEDNLDDYDVISFDCEPGDVIIHHYWTLHGAGGNHSRYQVRRAASLRYAGEDIRYLHRPYAPQQLHFEHTLKDGDPLSGANFPIIWNKASDQIAA